MDANIIDWDKAQKSNDVEVLSLFYAFKNITEYLARNGGVDSVGDLKLHLDKEEKVSEEGFREFLKSIASIKWNEEELTKEQISCINNIQDYLKVPYKQAEQPIVKGETVSIKEIATVYGSKE